MTIAQSAIPQQRERAAPMPSTQNRRIERVVIATINRAEGDTGVHTNTRMLAAGLDAAGIRCDVVSAFSVTHLACNHSDPTISLGTYDVVFEGAQAAIADPLGMYIRRPNLELFTYRGAPLPDDWVRLGRGVEGHFQRLVLGPPDEHEAFLDDITISVGASEEPLTGGYQLLRELEIGPYLLFGDTDPIADDEWEVLPPAPAAIACNEPDSCASVRDHAARWRAAQAQRGAPRTMEGEG